MEFDAQSQKLKCVQCQNEMDIRVTQADYEGQEAVPQESFEEDDAAWKSGYSSYQGQTPDTMSMKIFHCQSCGAELMTDEYSSAVMCSFCGNPSLVEDRLQGAYKPKKIIPFMINRDQAKEMYRAWVKKGALTPSALKSSSTIEKISGLYVPFWLYDFKARSQMTVHAEKHRVTRSGNTETTYHDHYNVFRDVEADFTGIPADASEKMDDDKMDKMEPYDYSAMRPFAMEYLSGYLSERYNYTEEQMIARAERRVDNYITELTKETITGYNVYNILSNRISRVNTNTEYVLLPVWVLNCRYEGKEFQFMLNGQTGKIVANRPISKSKAVMWGVLTFVICMIITMLGGLIL